MWYSGLKGTSEVVLCECKLFGRVLAGVCEPSLCGGADGWEAVVPFVPAPL